jgi:ferrous iron transport protein A
MKTNIIPLAMVLSGKKVKIVYLAGGKKMQERLISMGFGPGSEIEVIRRGDPGPFIVAIGEARMAIGTGMAQKIMVSENGI